MKNRPFVLCLIILTTSLVDLSAQEKMTMIQFDETEVDLELDRVIIQNELRGKLFSDEEIPSLRENVREGMIMRKLLVSLALYKGIEVDPKEVDEALELTRVGYPDDEWNELLSQQLYTQESFRLVLEESLLIDRVIEQEVLEKISISAEEIEAYYHAHKEDFTTDHGLLPLREVSGLIREDLSATRGQQETARFMENLYSRALFIGDE